MKFILIASMFLASSLSFASIRGSSYEARHLKVIEKAISANCGFFFSLTQNSSQVEVIRVDNGITDYKFETAITGIQHEDQYITFTYKISVSSSYSDSFDHSEYAWGSYSVESVSCERQ